MRLAVLSLVLFVFAWAPAAGAQALRVDVRDAPLEAVLRDLRDRTGIDLVYAQRLVAGRTATCRYAGARVEEAVACVLATSGLRAEPVRPGQYVLVAPAQADAAAPTAMLAGRVLDAETGLALPGAHVYLAALRRGAVADADGRFRFSDLPRGRYRARVSYLGFAPMDTTLAADSVAVLRLEPRPLEAGDVVVEDDGGASDGALPTDVFVPVGALADLPVATGERDLLQTLTWLPGVRHSGEIGGGLVVRGAEPDQNLYLLDGAPVYHPWHAFSLVSTFQSETFRDVRFYRGAFPAEHGGRLAAILDVEMKDGAGERTIGQAALSPLSGRFAVEVPATERVSVLLAGRRSYLDQLVGREHPVEGEDGRRDTLRTGYYFYDLSGKVSARLGRHRLAFTHYRGGDDLDLRLPFDVSLDLDAWLRPADLFFEIRQRWGNALYTLRHQYLHAPHLFVTTTAYRSAYEADEAAAVQPTGTTRLASDYAVRLDDVGVKVDVDYYGVRGHGLRAGVHAAHRRFRSALTADLQRAPGVGETLAETSRLWTWEVAAYVQDAWQPSARWRVLPGLRLSALPEAGYVALDPRLAVRYTVVPGRVAAYAALGRQVQYLHRLRDRYSFLYDLVSNRWVPAGPSVRPARQRSVEAGLEVEPYDGVALAAAAYWRTAADVLQPEDAFRTKDGLEGPGIDVGALLGQYTPASARAYGIELTGRLVRGPWQLWATYSGGRALVDVSTESAGYRPGRFDVPRTFHAALRRTAGRWAYALAFEARSGYPHTVPVARYVLGDPLTDTPTPYFYQPRVNNGRLPPHLRLDASVGYGFRWREARWRASLHVYNLTNRRNVTSRRYDPAASVVVGEDRRGLPFLPLFELSVAR